MKLTRKTLLSVSSALIALSVMSAAATGCGDDDDAPVTPRPDQFVPPVEGGGGDVNRPETGPTNPPVPTLGAQIDRMGRPAVNTALTGTFAATAAGDALKDAYNKDATQSGWVAAYRAEVSKNLAVYDGLDENCGNQAAASKDAGAQNSNILKYGALGGVLSDDRLWLNSAGTTGAQYLAVELNATGIFANGDQGGRKLPMDVVDITYSALAAGVLMGVTDGIAADATKTGGTAFPYLATPLQ